MSHTDTDLMRTGAKDCLAALQAIEKMIEVENHISHQTEQGQAWEQDVKGLRTISKFLQRASGVTSPYTAGFLSVFAEYLCMCNTAGTPNLEPDGWVPYAAMTDMELAESKQLFEDTCL